MVLEGIAFTYAFFEEVVWPNGHVIGASAQTADSDPVTRGGFVGGSLVGKFRAIDEWLTVSSPVPREPVFHCFQQ